MVVLHSLAITTQAALKMFIRYYKWICMFTVVTRQWDGIDLAGVTRHASDLNSEKKI